MAPPRLQALSADARLLERLRGAPAAARVHSVFERVVNIEPEQGGLFTLAARHVDDAPETLVIDIGGWADCGVERGDPVRLGDGAIALRKDVVIQVDAAQPWDCALPGYPADTERLRENLAEVRDALRAAQARQPFSEAAACADGLLDAALDRLAAAWDAGDEHSAASAARFLIGLGPGLTPAGDDILLGLLAAWHLPGHPCASLAARAGDMLRDLDRRTNAISAAALRAAAAGRVREAIVALLRELVQGTPCTVRPPLDRVLAIGSSSGADIVRGLAAGLAMDAH